MTVLHSSSRFNPLRRLQWKLTFSYTLVTVAALMAVELLVLLGLLVFLNSDFLVSTLVTGLRDGLAPQAQAYLDQNPPDIDGLDDWMRTTFAADGTIAETEEGFAVTRGLSVSFGENPTAFVLSPDGELLASSLPSDDPLRSVAPFDQAPLDGLTALWPAATGGVSNVDDLYAVGPDGRLVTAIPIFGQERVVKAIMVVQFALPSFTLATLGPLARLVLLSLVPLTLAAGAIGTLFGYLTARGLSRRLQGLALASDAWSQGDFSLVAEDRSGDELGHLSRRLNRMAEQLQNLLAARQELAMLEERNRLARDLHDSVKQQVFATAMQVGAARALLAEDPAAAAPHLDEAEQLARQAQRELAGLIQELRPAALAGRGLADALRDYVADWSRRSEIAGQMRVQGERPLPLPVEQALFRVAQEALSNVARHSGAATADVHLALNGEEATLTVQDDGRGFDVAEGERRGFGTQSMRERIEALDGRLSIESGPGAGAKVVARLPVGAGRAAHFENRQD